MNKAYIESLARSKNAGIQMGIEACCRVMAVAFYNAACERLPDLSDAQKGTVYAQMRTEMLEILRQGGSDTYSEEIEAAASTALARMAVQP